MENKNTTYIAKEWKIKMYLLSFIKHKLLISEEWLVARFFWGVAIVKLAAREFRLQC